jgi:hypothetical protein
MIPHREARSASGATSATTTDHSATIDEAVDQIAGYMRAFLSRLGPGSR